MTGNFSFSMESTPNFSFDLYEHVPVGEHRAAIKDIIVENDIATSYGMKDRYTIVFYLYDRDCEFKYIFFKSKHEKSKYFDFFKLLCSALCTTHIDGSMLTGQKLIITISLVPHFDGSDRMMTKITNIRKDDTNNGLCS